MANTKLPARLLDDSVIPAAYVSGTFAVDTNTLRVDAVNNRVGIGESSPARKLSVRRDTGITAGFNDISEFLDTTIGAGGSVSLNLGRANSTKNLGKMAFKYAGSGSNSNALNFGFYDADNLMTLTAAGNVGIGHTNPAAALNISSASDALLTIQNNIYQGSGQNTESIFRFKSGAGTDDERAKGGILFKNDGSAYGRGDLHFLVDSNDDNGNAVLADSKMVISHEGNVGIKTTSPLTKFHVHNGSDAENILIVTGADTTTEYISLGTSGGVGVLKSGNIGAGATALAFETAASNGAEYEQMRINSSGEIQIGGTSNAGFIDFDGNKLQLNTQRNPNNGAFVNTSKSHASIELDGSGGGSAINFRTSGSNNTASSLRWTIQSNGHLKAFTNGLGINFDASEHSAATSTVLDDYEEGTWTPVLTGSTGAPTISYQFQSAFYTKIGTIIYVRFGLRVLSISGGSGAATISGLPYTAKSYGSFQQPAMFVNAQGLTTDADGPALFYVQDNGAALQGRLMNNADTVLPLSYFQAGSWCIGNITYDVV